LPTRPTILAIVRDDALLRALAFALQAHGYQVSAQRAWEEGMENMPGASCVILDGCLSAAEREACLSALPPEKPILLLAEDDTVFAARPLMQVLHKPLSGADVVAALSALRGNP
jgi:DNA-binding response OmpR family regulator